MSTNIHDYIERIGAKPPPVDEKELAEAMKSVIWVNSIEEAADVIIKLDADEPTLHNGEGM